MHANMVLNRSLACKVTALQTATKPIHACAAHKHNWLQVPAGDFLPT